MQLAAAKVIKPRDPTKSAATHVSISRLVDSSTTTKRMLRITESMIAFMVVSMELNRSRAIRIGKRRKRMTESTIFSTKTCGKSGEMAMLAMIAATT